MTEQEMEDKIEEYRYKVKLMTEDELRDEWGDRDPDFDRAINHFDFGRQWIEWKLVDEYSVEIYDVYIKS